MKPHKAKPSKSTGLIQTHFKSQELFNRQVMISNLQPFTTNYSHLQQLQAIFCQFKPIPVYSRLTQHIPAYSTQFSSPVRPIPAFLGAESRPLLHPGNERPLYCTVQYHVLSIAGSLNCTLSSLWNSTSCQFGSGCKDDSAMHCPLSTENMQVC